jgi:hypothetical protein
MVYIMSDKTRVDVSNNVVDETIRKLEADGHKQVINALSGTKPVTADTFMNIIKKGADEFKAKTGRQMTYAEMRDAFG